MVLSSARRQMLVNICMKFHEDILNSFQVTERTRFCEGQTHRRTDRQITGQIQCLPTLKGGDIIEKKKKKKSRKKGKNIFCQTFKIA